MAKAKKTLIGIGLAVAVAAIAIGVRAVVYRPLASVVAVQVAPGDGLGYPWRGAIHVHTSISDGASGIEEVMEAAGKAGLDFLVLSDHNTIGEVQRPAPGWYGNVLLIVAEEISTEEGHLLAMEVPPHRYRFGPTARQALDDIHSEGGWALVSHPDHERQPWTGGWGGSVGIEVANMAAAWSRIGVLTGALAAVTFLVDSDRAAADTLGGGWPALRLWDSLVRLQTNPTVISRPRIAIGAADAHGPIVGSLPAPAYADTLAVLTTLVWIDEPPGGPRSAVSAARVQAGLLEALRSGRAAVEATALGDGRAFSFNAVSTATGDRARMGDLAAWEQGEWIMRADFDSAGPFRMTLLRDGEVIATSEDGTIEAAAARPGTYRVEVYRTDIGSSAGGEAMPWIVGNPIYLWPAPARAASRILRTPPLPPPPLSASLLEASNFEANHIGVANNTVAVSDEGVSWSFALQTPSAREAFAAMAWRPEEPMDWSATSGVVIHLESERPLRARLEFRTPAADGSLQSWVHSVRAEPAALPVAVAWDSFRPPWSEDEPDVRSADARHPGIDDLRSVHGVFLVVTPVMLAPGSEVNATLRTLGLYGRR